MSSDEHTDEGQGGQPPTGPSTPSLSPDAVDVGSAHPAPSGRSRKGRVAAMTAGALLVGTGIGYGVWNARGEDQVESSAVTTPVSTLAVSGSASGSDDAVYPPGGGDFFTVDGEGWVVGAAYRDGFLLVTTEPPADIEEGLWTLSMATTTDGVNSTPVGEPVEIGGFQPEVRVDGDNVVIAALDGSKMHLRQSTDLSDWSDAQVDIDGLTKPEGWTEEADELATQEWLLSGVEVKQDRWVGVLESVVNPSDALLERAGVDPEVGGASFYEDGLVVYDDEIMLDGDADVVVGAEGGVDQAEGDEEVTSATIVVEEEVLIDDVGDEIIPYEDLGISPETAAVLSSQWLPESAPRIVSGDLAGTNASVVATPEGGASSALVVSDAGFVVAAEVWPEFDADAADENFPNPSDVATQLWRSVDGVEWTNSEVTVEDDTLVPWGILSTSDGGVIMGGMNSFGGPLNYYKVSPDNSVTLLGEVTCPDGLEASPGSGPGGVVLITVCTNEEEVMPHEPMEIAALTSQYKIEGVDGFTDDEPSLSYTITDRESGEVVAENSISGDLRALEAIWAPVEIDGEMTYVFPDQGDRPDVHIPADEFLSAVEAQESSEVGEEFDEDAFADVIVAELVSVDGVNWTEIGRGTGFDGPDSQPVAVNGNLLLVETYGVEAIERSVITLS